MDGTQFADQSYLGQVTVTLTAVDDRTGVALIEYSLDKGNTWNVYTAPFLLSNDGEQSVWFRATDRAGNVEAAKMREVTVKAATLGNLRGKGYDSLARLRAEVAKQTKFIDATASRDLLAMIDYMLEKRTIN